MGGMSLHKMTVVAERWRQGTTHCVPLMNVTDKYDGEGQAAVTVDHKLWHERLGHIYHQSLLHLSKTVNGLYVEGVVNSDFCETCVEGKMTNLPFKGTRPSTTRALEGPSICYVTRLGGGGWWVCYGLLRGGWGVRTFVM